MVALLRRHSQACTSHDTVRTSTSAVAGAALELGRPSSGISLENWWVLPSATEGP